MSQIVAEAIAKRTNRDATELLYDRMLERDGRELLLVPVLNYSELSADPIREMMFHPRASLGLGDGGAHCGVICDASIQTFMLTHWVRDRSHDQLLLEFVVNKMTAQTAALYGLGDRGALVPGLLGDANVIDFDALRLPLPELVHDLPADARRFVQGSEGYVATIGALRRIAPVDPKKGALNAKMPPSDATSQ